METVMHSERVNFVHMDPKYVDFYVENMNNPEIYRFITSTPIFYTRDSELEWLKNNKELNQFTLINRENGEPIGNAGYHEIVDETGELGIWISPKYQDNHYGREIIERLIEYGYKELHLRKIRLKVFENNERAVHLYQSIGFVPDYYEEISNDGLGNKTRHIHMELKERRK